MHYALGNFKVKPLFAFAFRIRVSHLRGLHKMGFYTPLGSHPVIYILPPTETIVFYGFRNADFCEDVDWDDNYS